MNRNISFSIWKSINKVLCIVMSLMLFCVSCYDDEDLQQYVNSIDERLTQLETTLKNVQDDMNSVKALAQALENKLTITSVLEDSDGNYLVTLSNDKVLKIRNSENTVPVITIQEEAGVYYWATELNGNITLLKDKNGNKMRVTAVAPEIRINEKSLEWEISVDGGKSWQSTGIVAGKDADCSIFSEVTQDELYAYFTLVDGLVIKLPKSQEFKFDILSGKQYFKAGETKQLKINTSGVEKYTISKPDGWKVNVNANGLNITAPVVENQYAETEGKITIVAISFTGQSLISEVPVTIGTAPIGILLNGEDVTVKMNGITTYYMGVMEVSAYCPEAVIQLLSDDLIRDSYLKNIDYNGTIADIDSRVTIQPEKSYVVWAIPNNQDKLKADDVLAVMFMQSVLTLNLARTMTFDATIEVILENCDSYYIGISETADYDINFVLEELAGEWSKDYQKTTGGLFSIADIPLNITILPGKSYTIWAALDKPGLTEKDIITLDCTLSQPRFDGQATVKFTNIQTKITEAVALCEPSGDAVKYYYAYLTADKISTYTTDEALILDYLIKQKSGSETTLFEIKNLSPESQIYLMAVALDKDEKFGPLTKEKVTTLPITYDGTASATVSVVPSFDSGLFTFTPTGNPAKYRYIHLTKQEFEQSYGFNSNIEQVKRKLALNSDYRITIVNADVLLNNELNISGLSLSTNYEFFALVEDESGQLNDNLIHISYSTKSYTIIRESDVNYKQPIVKISECISEGRFYTVKYLVTPIEGTVKMYVRYTSKEVYNNQISWKDKHNYVLNIPDYGENGSGIFEGENEVEITRTFATLPGYVMVVCVTASGDAYQVYNHEVIAPVVPETSEQ